MMYPQSRGMGIVQPPNCAQPWCIPGKTDCSTWWGFFTSPQCATMLPSDWAKLGAAVGTPPAPTGAALTVPPASGEQAQQLVDQLTAQQMAAQQAANAAQVDTTVESQVGGTIYQAGQTAGDVGTAVANALPSLNTVVLLGAAGLGAFLLIKFGSR